MTINTHSHWAKPLFIAACVVSLASTSLPAAAQRVPAADLMPPPKAAPRTAVKSERLADLPQRELKGQASAQDGGTIQLQTFDGRNYDLRLAGLIIPSLTDPKGIAARVALDELMQARTISCTRRDRDSDGKLLVTCMRDDGVDLSMQMLRDGIMLFTRNGNLSEAFITAYRAAESAAQKEQRGLWQDVPTMPTSSVKTKTITPVIIEGTANAGTVKIQEKMAPVAMADTPTNASQITPTSVTLVPDVVAPVVVPQPVAVAAPAETAAAPRTTFAMPTPEGVTDTMGFFFAASLIGTLLLGISLFDFLGRRRVRYAHEWEVRHNRQILAAALGGELAAARDVCESRMHSITAGAAPTWPRLRSYVYQTHVDKIGLLGPFLARQVASIYGQMADYASVGKDGVDSAGMSREAMVKSLNRLCGYVDVALEGLAEVEVTGELPLPAIPVDYQAQQLAQHQAQQRVTEARQRQQAIVHKPAPAQQATPQRAVATAAPRQATRTQTAYTTYGEAAAQKIMEEEIIRARAEELLKAKASPMKRRTAAKPVRDAQQDTHHADLLGLEDEAVVYTERPARSAKAKG